MQSFRLILFLYIIFNGVCYAQIDKQVEYYENKSYQLFLNRNWEDLMKLLDEAFDKNINSYFLSLRFGIAKFEIGEYMNASDFFETALNYSPGDFTAKKYLYLSYLFSGRADDAYKIGMKLTEADKKLLKISEKKFVDNAYLEGGYNFNGNFNSTKNKYLRPKEIGDEFGYQKLFKHFSYGSLLIKHNISENITLNHGPGLLNLSYIEQFVENNGKLNTFNVNTNQLDYYLNLLFHPSTGFTFGIAGHYLNVDINSMKRGNGINAVYTPVNEILNEYLLAVNLSNYFKNLKIGYTGTYSVFNSGKQIQNELSLEIYPLYNLNLYFTDNLVFHVEKTENVKKFSDFKVINNFNSGFKITDYLWLEAGFSFGNISNYNESFGFIIYNNLENIKRRINLNIVMPFKHGTAYLRYQNQLIEHQISITSNFPKTLNIDNTNHLLIGGLKWNF